MTVQLPLSVQDAVAAQAIAESYRENGFDNDLASLYLDAFIDAYGSTNANINRQTVCSGSSLLPIFFRAKPLR